MVKPEDFASDHPPVRIIGSEIEYDVQVLDALDKKSDLVDVFTEIANTESLKALGLLPEHHPSNSSPTNFFLKNGSKLYLDVENFFEYATPESFGPVEATLTELAGNEIMRLLDESQQSHNLAIYKRVGFVSLFGSNESSGYHENYLINKSWQSNELFDRIMKSYLATRQVWSGAGMVDTDFEVSQKAQSIASSNDNISNTKHGRKPFYDIRTDPDTAGAGFFRFETRCTDAIHSPLMRFIGFAATSLTLRLLEQNYGLRKINRYSLQSPERANREISGDTSLQTIHQTLKAGEISAIEYQQLLAETALELSSKINLPEEEIKAAKIWYDICDSLHTAAKTQDFTNLVDKIEWVARQYIISKKIGSSSLSKYNDSAVALDLLWDRIDIDGIGKRWWAKQSHSLEYADLNDYLSYTLLPPQKTRAVIRSNIISNNAYQKVEWNSVKSGGDLNFNFQSPYA